MNWIKTDQAAIASAGPFVLEVALGIDGFWWKVKLPISGRAVDIARDVHTLDLSKDDAKRWPEFWCGRW